MSTGSSSIVPAGHMNYSHSVLVPLELPEIGSYQPDPATAESMPQLPPRRRRRRKDKTKVSLTSEKSQPQSVLRRIHFVQTPNYTPPPLLPLSPDDRVKWPSVIPPSSVHSFRARATGTFANEVVIHPPERISELGSRETMEHTFWVNATGSWRSASLPEPSEVDPEQEFQVLGVRGEAKHGCFTQCVAPEALTGADTQIHHPSVSGRSRKRKASVGGMNVVRNSSRISSSESVPAAVIAGNGKGYKKRRCTPKEPLSPSRSHLPNVDLDHTTLLSSSKTGSVFDVPFRLLSPQRLTFDVIDSTSSTAHSAQDQNTLLPSLAVDSAAYPGPQTRPPSATSGAARTPEAIVIDLESMIDGGEEQEELSSSVATVHHLSQVSTSVETACDVENVDANQVKGPTTRFPENFTQIPSLPIPSTMYPSDRFFASPAYMHDVPPYPYVTVPWFTGQPVPYPWVSSSAVFSPLPEASGSGSHIQPHASQGPVPSAYLSFPFSPVPTLGSLPPFVPAPMHVPVPLPVPATLPNLVAPPNSWSEMFNTLKCSGPSVARHTVDSGSAMLELPADGGIAITEILDPKVKGRGRDKGPHQCPLCLRVFRFGNGLALHLKWHWGASRLEWKQGVSQSGLANARARAEAGAAERSRARLQCEGAADAGGVSMSPSLPTSTATSLAIPDDPATNAPLESYNSTTSSSTRPIITTPPRKPGAQSNSSAFPMPVISWATPRLGSSFEVFTSRFRTSPEAARSNTSTSPSASLQGTFSFVPSTLKTHFPWQSSTHSVLQTPERNSTDDAASAVRSSPYDDLFDGDDSDDDTTPRSPAKEVNDDAIQGQDGIACVNPANVEINHSTVSEQGHEGSRSLSPLVQFAALQLLP
ncbi:hypothetical protein SCP_1401690 [Sparassis crispa]|uniref:C2H2-type domain-containing protein n=1 Tax=Sparassis crispa TaxID=139825 RepID=A0A401H2Y1_9APHY|nr:hypothetical protein SCP_1401690 [Sparassis crispa]GBE88764.1 hypothetical protein SCP_1401690 [Sparassis crispa]